jgi:L-ascorbate metabolism protein UlaG (beta-lactamase superfamily)
MSSITIDSARIQWLGHSSFLLEWDGKKVYIDPFEIGKD